MISNALKLLQSEESLKAGCKVEQESRREDTQAGNCQPLEESVPSQAERNAVSEDRESQEVQDTEDDCPASSDETDLEIKRLKVN